MNEDATAPAQPGRSQWIGKPMRRLGDEKLLTGRGRFTDDLELPGALHAAFARSPHAHARIVAIDASAARAAPGVVAVLTGADILADGIGPLPFLALHKRPDGAPITAPPRYPITPDVARFVGDAVGIVLAETRDAAKDAAELVAVEWEPLPAVVDLEAAGRDDAPPVWPPAFAPGFGNIAAHYRMGAPAAVDAAFARAHRVVRLAVVNNRVIANPIEPRAAAAAYDAGTQSFTLWCPVQNTHLVSAQFADAVFRVPREKFRVVCGDLGGGFGNRAYPYPEYAAVAWAARRTGRPVKWRADRSEAFLTDCHGRDNVSEAELAIDAGHRFLALRVKTLANVGAYVSHYGTAVPAMSGVRAPTGAYAIPLLDHEVRMLFTHTTPVDAYRGAGRPEMGYLLERLVSRAATELGVDPVALRRRNFVPAAAMPWKNPAGYTYDCGNFERVMDAALAAADWAGFPARKAEAAKRGRLAGRGIAYYVEVTGSNTLSETVEVRVGGDGAVTVLSGTQAMGTSLWTSYAQIVAERLGVDPRAVVLVQGDTALVKTGGGSGGSRSLQVGGGAVLAGANAVIEVGRRLAARELEAAEQDIEYVPAARAGGDSARTAGVFRIAGTDRAIGLFDLAARQPAGRIDATATETAKGQTWPNGCQVAEVEIDPETGEVRVTRLAAVDDIGRVMNPMVAHGQVEGGIVQGIGQALVEACVHDRETGQLLTGTFMDYGIPR
ncbi:MAG: xanthine dehydrogenase family protein molybdopterin-binding subunit, partial [Burkholderiales bacterium]|nr:xanthine dehydrogenase family protein molybdopterin-binding subunit [Burkholderiales bacterium]